MNRSLILQLAIVGVCAWSMVEFAVNFPYPSPIVRPLLPPKERWPSEEITGWVEVQNFPSSFLEYFGRDPQRAITPGANLVAPADGTITNEFYRDGASYLVI